MDGWTEADQRVIYTDLQSLRTLTDRFLYAITSMPQRMPFGIRYTAREMFRGLQVKFPGESGDSLAKVVLHMIYYRYLQPAVVSVDSFIPEQDINLKAGKLNILFFWGGGGGEGAGDV
jgi:hypothetical protein